MKVIVFPTDFSENARNAALMAAKVALGSGATLHLVHITRQIENPFLMDDSMRESYNDDRFEVVADSLKEEKVELQKAHPQLAIKSRTINGLVQESLLEYASKEKADMIVMGTQGATGLKKVVVGSVTVNTIANSKVPVLCVPMNYQDKGEYDIILADPRLPRKQAVFEPTLALARALKSNVKMLHINEDKKWLPKDKKQDYEKYLEQQQLEIENTLLETGDENVEDAIQKMCDAKGAGILALVNFKQGFIKRLFRPSLAEQLAFQSEIPLLVQPDS